MRKSSGWSRSRSAPRPGVAVEGVYLWESRASAEAWFTEDRIVELTKRFGVRPSLTWYDTHVTVDNLKGETRVLAEAG